jgi:putative ABC transport system permease protein
MRRIATNGDDTDGYKMTTMLTTADELRHALRSLARSHRISLVAITLFAVTVGVTTAIYAVIDAVMLRPIGLGAPDRTVVIWQRDDTRGTPVVEVAHGEVDAWRRNARSFEALGLFSSVNWSLSLVDGESRSRVAYVAVSAPFFDVVGLAPASGRLLDSRDELGNEPRAVVISDQLWRQRFGASPQIIGAVVRVQEDIESPVRSLEVVGVMPPAFDFPRGTQLWIPAAPSMRALAQRAGRADAGEYLASLRVFYALARLRHDASPAQAVEELTTISTRQQNPAGSVSSVVATPINTYLQGPARPVLWTMLAGALLMLLLSCSSVAGLQVFRTAIRDHALAVHMALGAERRGLIVRAVLEGGLLALAGFAGAIVIAWVTTEWLVSSAPLDVPRLDRARLTTPSVALFMVGLTAIVGALTSLWPAFFVGRIDAGRTLTSGARTVMHPRERRLQRLVVGWQVAVAVVLLAGAALFVRSVHTLDRTDVGFRAEGLLSLDVEPSWKELERWDAFYDGLLSRTAELSGVANAGAVYLRPLSGPIGNDTIPVLYGQEGLGENAPWRSNPRANTESVTSGYFRTLGIPLLRGRDVAPTDVAAAPNVVIVSASAAARYWPGRDPIGQRIVVATQRSPGDREELRWQTVVGVVGDVRYRGLLDPRLDIYLPAAQSTMRVKHLLIRTTGPAEPVIARVRAIARELDPGVHVGEVVLMSDVLARESAPWRFAMRVLVFFGGLAAALATIGLIGIVWLVVAMQRRELGIRAALGASPKQLRTHVLKDALWTTSAATIAGVLGALAVGRALTGVLVGTSPHDPLSLAGAAAVAVCAGGIGCVLAAQGAARASPTEALRD